MGLQVAAQDQWRAVLDADLPASASNCGDGALGGIGCFEVDGHAERSDAIGASAENLDAVLHLGDHALLKEQFHRDRLQGTQVALLDEVSDASEVDRLQVVIIVETPASETSFGVPQRHGTLPALETTIDFATGPRVRSFVATSTGLALTAALTSAHSFGDPSRSWVVPESIGRHGEPLILVHHLRSESSASRCSVCRSVEVQLRLPILGRSRARGRRAMSRRRGVLEATCSSKHTQSLAVE